MDIIFYYIVIGLAGGLIGGFLGLGGGIVFVPSLLFVFTYYDINYGYELQSAIITSIGCVFISSISAMITHQKNKLVLWATFQKTFLGISLGASLGVYFLSNTDTSILKLVYSISLILIAIFMFTQPKIKQIKIIEYKLVHLFSIFVGIISTLLGIGGGTLTTPYFNVHGHDIKKSIATASACGVLIASIAIIIVFMQHLISYEKSLLPLFSLTAFASISISAALSSYIGATLTLRAKSIYLKRVFALSILIISIIILVH